jgi:hypothetical protein
MLSASIKQRINSTYANYNDGTIELEARFGQIVRNSFKPGVPREVFNRIREYFDQRSQAVEIKTTDYISQNVRKTVTIPVGDEIPEVIWITKNRLWNQEDKDYGIRYSMSREIPIQPVANFVPEIIREKNRYSYVVFNNMVKIDITMVNMVQLEANNGTDKTIKDITKYEIEVELLNPRGLDSFEKALIVTLQKILDTIILYKDNEATSLINYVNSLLGSDKNGLLDHYPLVQARNLKLKDMVWGGLVGNDKTGYSVTHKADGQRKLLVFHTTGIWLAMAPRSLNRITNTEIPELTGTILDGEMIPSDKKLPGAPDSRIWYLAFDALVFSNNNIMGNPHGVRMNHAQAVADSLKNKLIWVNTKTFKNFTTPQEFFKVMREMFREQQLLSYKQDGFMFTPVNTIYNPHSDNYSLYQRVLTDYPDICKWKPHEQLTIDFQIQWIATPEGQKVQLYVNNKGRPVLFKGTKVFPFTDQVDSNHELTRGLPSGTIVEYGYDNLTNTLVPIKIRYDKNKPNKIDIAEDVWMDINRPLDRNTMEGNTFTLLRAYHNRIKKELFDNKNLTQLNQGNSIQANGGTLLDIGSGRGGDVSKWKNFSKIVAVEPNKEHIVELERRIKLNGMENRVMIVNAGGEDTHTIYNAVRSFIGERVDVISMMLSMSFFWRSQFMVGKLINTLLTNIKETGKFIFLTIDGDLVEQTFEPAFQTGPALTKLKLNQATLEYFGNKNPKELKIHIEDSIVEDQTEWLVRLGDLIIGLRNFGFDFSERKRADSERFLTEEEITMTQMYTYGIISKVRDGNELLELDEIKIINENEKMDLQILDIPDVKQIAPQITELREVVLETIPLVGDVPEFEVEMNLSDIAEYELPLIPMDTFQKIRVSWYPHEVVVRIGAIGKWFLLFSCLLGGYYPPYQNNSSAKFRVDFVRKLRRDLAYTLEMEDPNHPGKILWETAANGQFVALYEQQTLGLDFQDLFGFPLDFSLEGLQRLFNSNSYLGDEVYQYASDMLGVDVYIMRLTNKDLHVHLNTSVPGLNRKAIVISGNGNHYETVGIERNGLFQTVFDNNDPFIISLKQLTKD